MRAGWQFIRSRLAKLLNLPSYQSRERPAMNPPAEQGVRDGGMAGASSPAALTHRYGTRSGSGPVRHQAFVRGNLHERPGIPCSLGRGDALGVLRRSWNPGFGSRSGIWPRIPGPISEQSPFAGSPDSAPQCARLSWSEASARPGGGRFVRRWQQDASAARRVTKWPAANASEGRRPID